MGGTDPGVDLCMSRLRDPWKRGGREEDRGVGTVVRPRCAPTKRTVWGSGSMVGRTTEPGRDLPTPVRERPDGTRRSRGLQFFLPTEDRTGRV